MSFAIREARLSRPIYLDLLIVMGKLSKPGCGLAPLAEENNEQGAVEMGAVAELLPGAIEVTDKMARDRLAGIWREELPPSPGASAHRSAGIGS